MNTIPDMTNPLGRHWDQPCRSEIEIDDTHALMSEHDFKSLLEYSSTIPSGVYDGKMWKAKYRELWLLKWYGPAEDPNKCSVNHREILIS